MTAALIIVPGACYAVAAAIYALRGQWGMAIVYSGYAWANAGLWLVDRNLK